MSCAGYRALQCLGLPCIPTPVEGSTEASPAIPRHGWQSPACREPLSLRGRQYFWRNKINDFWIHLLSAAMAGGCSAVPLLTCFPDPKNDRHRGQEKNNSLLGMQTPICPDTNLPPHQTPPSSYTQTIKIPQGLPKFPVFIFLILFLIFFITKEKKKNKKPTTIITKAPFNGRLLPGRTLNSILFVNKN